tara:strand:+ start:11522 stop:12607 length:1086 start_codon:yes stop_codon:yes gene_type:complete
MSKVKWAILGTVGVPGNYGGFETLAENLVRFQSENVNQSELTVYCSAKAYKTRPSHYLNADLRYINLNANGVQSIPYDMFSLVDAARRGTDVILLLGVSGALALPFIRLISRSHIVTNIDGIEWQREKWKGLAKLVLRWSERAAVRWSHTVVADNEAIAEHVRETYGSNCKVIAYGGDHALAAEPDPVAVSGLPDKYALALCRVEPENNVEMILQAFTEIDMSLVFVGNWDKSDYSRSLKARYDEHPNIILHNAVYAPNTLRAIRDRATMYVHGHSAGGTNPSLVEMMHFGVPILTHDNVFNRHTTEEKARYFSTAKQLIDEVLALDADVGAGIGREMMEIAQRRYTWSKIGQAYFKLAET